MIIYKNVSDVTSIITAHGVGVKSVLLSQTDSCRTFTQLAYGILRIDEVIQPHLHETMEEFYFFTKGEGLFTINDEKFKCLEKTFIKIPARFIHELKCTSATPLEFLYFGIAI